ncbi:MAG TPA: DUF4166 domain-containing protein [Fimbriimonas sp.]|nr:DUF4166 domain-containing protein [Fimbriimonas sp.]
MAPPFEARGAMKIVHAHKGIGGSLAKQIQLPPEGEKVPVSLSVTVDRGGITWTRKFGDFRAVSRQIVSGRTFTEMAGPFALTFRIEPRGKAVEHIQVKTQLFGVPVPRLLGPSVTGSIGPGQDESSWTVFVDIGHPWLGSICRYEGAMRIA